MCPGKLLDAMKGILSARLRGKWDLVRDDAKSIWDKLKVMGGWLDGWSNITGSPVMLDVEMHDGWFTILH